MSEVENNFNFKSSFDEKIKNINVRANSMAIVDEENYKKLINEVLEAKSRKNKTSLDCRRLNRYDIIKVGEVNKLIFPLNRTESNAVKYYLHNDEMYDVLEKSHKETGHGGLHKMIYHLKNDYINISCPVIQLYINNCVTCLKKKSFKKKRSSC